MVLSERDVSAAETREALGQIELLGTECDRGEIDSGIEIESQNSLD